VRPYHSRAVSARFRSPFVDNDEGSEPMLALVVNGIHDMGGMHGFGRVPVEAMWTIARTIHSGKK